jgi:hypothetical protein
VVHGGAQPSLTPYEFVDCGPPFLVALLSYQSASICLLSGLSAHRRRASHSLLSPYPQKCVEFRNNSACPHAAAIAEPILSPRSSNNEEISFQGKLLDPSSPTPGQMPTLSSHCPSIPFLQPSSKTFWQSTRPHLLDSEVLWWWLEMHIILRGGV